MQIERLTNKSQEALQAAQSLAYERGHQEIVTEHLLQAMLADGAGVAAQIMQKAGVNPADLQRGVTELLGAIPTVSGAGFGQVALSAVSHKMLDKAFKMSLKDLMEMEVVTPSKTTQKVSDGEGIPIAHKVDDVDLHIIVIRIIRRSLSPMINVGFTSGVGER